MYDKKNFKLFTVITYMVRSNYFIDDYFITNLFSSYSSTVQIKLDCWNDWLMKDGLLL